MATKTSLNISTVRVDKTVIYPVAGGWGQKGCTYIDLKKIKNPILKDALNCAYQNISTKKK